MAGLLWKRSNLKELFEKLSAAAAKHQGELVVTVGRLYEPVLRERSKSDFESFVTELGILLWQLDYGPLRGEDNDIVCKAREIREALVGAIREVHPNLPEIPENHWIPIEGGRFNRRTPEDGPVHEVKVSSFRLLSHQVTNAQFGRLFDAWTKKGESEPNHPATNLTWYEAYVFAAWLGGRLPTEAEWEYAARSRGKDQRYPWGDSADDIVERAVTSEGGHTGPLPVGSKPKGNTDQGVSDMAGNVREWVSDWYGSYSAEQQQDPWGPPTGFLRVIRGGSFVVPAARARVSNRNRRNPKNRNLNLGFRVVLAAADR